MEARTLEALLKLRNNGKITCKCGNSRKIDRVTKIGNMYAIIESGREGFIYNFKRDEVYRSSEGICWWTLFNQKAEVEDLFHKLEGEL